MPTAAEFVIPPLPPRSPPPIIDGPQPVCKCCFQRGHLYRDCNHPSLEQLHDLTIRVFVGVWVNPQRNYSRPDQCEILNFRKRFISSLPAFTMRALLWRTKHPDLLPPPLRNGQPAFPSIRAWRQRGSIEFCEQFSRATRLIVPDISEYMLPNRIGVYSAAARYDLEEMMIINYEKYAKDYLQLPENSYFLNTQTTICNAQSVAYSLNRYRRNLGSSGSSHTLTPYGLAVYLNDMIDYLTVMRDRQLLMIPSEFNFNNSQRALEAVSAWEPVDMPDDREHVSWREDRFVNLDRNSMLRNITSNWSSVQSMMGQNLNQNYIHNHFSGVTRNSLHSAPIDEERHPGFRLNAPGIPSNENGMTDDALHRYRNEATVANLLQEILPEPSLLPDGSDLETMNAPPDLPASVQRRTPTFNIHIEENDPSEFKNLHHNSCAICWDELTPETCCATNCKHTYCFGCITAAAKTERRKTERSHRTTRYMSLKCAMCRQEIQDLQSFSESDETRACLVTLRSNLYTPCVRPNYT